MAPCQKSSPAGFMSIRMERPISGRPRLVDVTVASAVGPWGSETAVDRNSVAGERALQFYVAPIVHGTSQPVGAVLTETEIFFAQ